MGASDLIKALQNTLRGGGRSLIAALTSRPLFTLPARVMVLFAVSASCRNIWSGPEHRHCTVHNGLTLTRAQRLAAQLPTPSPWGDPLFADLASLAELCRSGLRY